MGSGDGFGRGLLLALEGGDGAGKSTQMALLAARCAARGLGVETLHFPRYTGSAYGELIAEYLRGDLGSLEAVPPKLVALLYAGDRRDAQGQIGAWLAAGRVVILDRYYASNLAYQGAKVEDASARDGLMRWMLELELGRFGVRPADMTLYLQVPADFSQGVLRRRGEEGARGYLRGQADIHEASGRLQGRVRALFAELGAYIPGYQVVDCSDGSGGILPPERVHGLVWACVEGLVEGLRR